MASKDAPDVAKRCLCLELLLQRVGLEVDDEDPADEREAIRVQWVARLGDLGLSLVVLREERALLERPVGELTEDEVDEMQGQASAALVFLWALGRLPAPPSVESVIDMPDLVAEHGVLGSGSISAALATVAASKLRPDAELREALETYAAKQGDGSAERELEPSEVVAVLTTHALDWIIDRYAKYEYARV